MRLFLLVKEYHSARGYDLVAGMTCGHVVAGNR